MTIRNLRLKIVGLIILLGISFSAYPVYTQSLHELRVAQDKDFSELYESFDERALNDVPRTKNGAIDTSSQEYKLLKKEYSARRIEIRSKYTQLDSRGRDLDSVLTDPKYNKKLHNTGSTPANVNADVDLKADDIDTAKNLSDHWRDQKGTKPIEYYTVDDPITPKTKPPEDFEKVVKVVNPNSDTTLWTPETDEIRNAKIKDPDAWTTSGGQKGTGNIEMSRDKRGYFLDNEKKFVHADRPVTGTSGMHDEDLKTFSKSVSKAGGSQGANISKNNPEFYNQASKMQKYGDPVEAGIVDLGDSLEVRKQKIEKWKQTARNEMNKAQIQSQKLGDAADTARDDLAEQMRNQGNDDVAERIEGNRRKVADSNRDAAAENERLRKESEELRKGNKKEGMADADGLDSDRKSSGNLEVDDVPSKKPDASTGDVDPGGKGKGSHGGDISSTEPEVSVGEAGSGDKTKIGSPDELPSKKPDMVSGDPGKTKIGSGKGTDTPGELPSTKQQKMTAGGDVDVDIGGKKNKSVSADLDVPPGGKKAVKTTGVDVDLPNSKKKVDVDVDGVIGASEVLETAGQAFQSGTKAAGDAIDENRDLNTGDAVKVVKDLTPGVREYEATKGALEKRRLESLERQEKIRQLKAKDKLTLDEELELTHLEHEEKRNPNTAAGDISAIVSDKAQSYVDKMEEKAKKEGRDKAEFLKDGVPMFGEIMKDGVNVINPINQIGTPIAEGLSEVSTWEQRQAWASHKDTITKYVNGEAVKVDKNTRRNTDKLNQLLTEGDLSDPEVQKNIDSLLAELKKDSERLDKLNAAADKSLQEVDPEKLKYLRGLKTALPDITSLEKWRDELTKEQLKKKSEVKSCPENTVKLSDDNDIIQCVSCDELYGDFNAALDGNDKGYAQVLLDLAPNCGWVTEGNESIRNAESCPENTVKLRDDNDIVQCVPCDELYADFNAALESNDKGYAQTLLDLAPNCGWVAEGNESIRNAESCPENTVRLSDDNDTIQCVSCDELYGDFNAALDGGDMGYAQTLLDMSTTCSWTADGNTRIGNAISCPADTVKLSDNSGNNQCVPCEALYGDYRAALSSGDGAYAKTLVSLASTCDWSRQARNDLNKPQPCPGGTVKLSDQNNQDVCVPCETLYGDFSAAMQQGDTGYAETLVNLASECSWSHSAAQQMYNANQQAELDQKCNQQAPGSHAVINGDQYICQCGAGMLTLTDQNGTSCQSCEQVRGYVNSALQRNDLNSIRGLMAGAQSCGWYDNAVQVLANIEQENQQRQDQRNQQMLNDFQNQLNTFVNQRGNNTKYNGPPPKSQNPRPGKQNPPPSRASSDGCSGGSCCTGHQLYCKQRGTEYSYPRTALDKNTDWVCDICRRPFKTQQGRLAPGLRGAQRGDVSCRH